MIMERIYGYGMTTTSGGNLSIKDDNGDIWITPAGIDKGSLTRNDIMCVKKDGTIIGPHKPSSEFPFHKKVYETRPDVHAVLHAHPPALVAFSIVRKIPNTKILPGAYQVCGEVGLAPYDVPGSEGLGDKIAAVFAKGINTVILENHGVCVADESIYKAFMRFETLDFCARIEIKARELGKPIVQKDEDLKVALQKHAPDMSEFIPARHSSEENAARRDMAALISRSYDQGLFTSTQGTFSQRLHSGAHGEVSFLITPYMIDRKYMGIEDLVLIQNGMREAGKTPSRSALLHKRIYELHPEINAIIIAHSPNLMAFAITEAKFDSKTIPESYIMLRNMPRLPFGASFMLTEDLAETFTPQNPVVIINSESVIATGANLVNAFDRMEVAEYSAKAIIASRVLGDIVMINKKEVEDINKAFHLE
jgi:L-fuculose-phosphate aldolase